MHIDKYLHKINGCNDDHCKSQEANMDSEIYAELNNHHQIETQNENSL